MGIIELLILPPKVAKGGQSINVLYKYEEYAAPRSGERCRTPMMVRVVCLRYYSFLFESVDQIDVSAGLTPSQLFRRLSYDES